MESDTESGSIELLSFDSDSQSSEFSVTEASCSEVDFSSESERQLRSSLSLIFRKSIVTNLQSPAKIQQKTPCLRKLCTTGQN